MGKQIIALQNGNEVIIYVQLQNDSYTHNAKKDSHPFSDFLQVKRHSHWAHHS